MDIPRIFNITESAHSHCINMFTPAIRDKFEEALREDQLHQIATDMAERGLAPEAIYVQFEAFMLYLRWMNRENEENLLADTMDCIFRGKLSVSSNGVIKHRKYSWNSEAGLDQYIEMLKAGLERGV